MANPFDWHLFFRDSANYLKNTPFSVDKQIRDPVMNIYTDPDEEKKYTYYRDELPAQVMYKIAKLPVIGNKKKAQEFKKFIKMK